MPQSPGTSSTGNSPVHTETAARALLDSPEFKSFVTRRWRVSLLLTVCLFIVYYGYILLIATNRELLGRRIGEATTLGIPLGAAVILGAWVLTALYVIWANRHHDVDAARLRDRLSRQGSGQE